jgi:hypothetical protein
MIRQYIRKVPRPTENQCQSESTPTQSSHEPTGGSNHTSAMYRSGWADDEALLSPAASKLQTWFAAVLARQKYADLVRQKQDNSSDEAQDARSALLLRRDQDALTNLLPGRRYPASSEVSFDEHSMTCAVDAERAAEARAAAAASAAEEARAAATAALAEMAAREAAARQRVTLCGVWHKTPNETWNGGPERKNPLQCMNPLPCLGERTLPPTPVPLSYLSCACVGVGLRLTNLQTRHSARHASQGTAI